MKKLTKLFTLALAGFMAFAFTGCSDSSDDGDDVVTKSLEYIDGTSVVVQKVKLNSGVTVDSVLITKDRKDEYENKELLEYCNEEYEEEAENYSDFSAIIFESSIVSALSDIEELSAEEIAERLEEMTEADKKAYLNSCFPATLPYQYSLAINTGVYLENNELYYTKDIVKTNRADRPTTPEDLTRMEYTIYLSNGATYKGKLVYLK